MHFASVFTLLLSSAEAADTLGGYALSAPLDRSGLTLRDGVWTRPASVGGEAGELTVTTCNGLVNRIMFTIVYALPDASSARFIRPTGDPVEDARSAVGRLGTALGAAGWSSAGEFGNIASGGHFVRIFALSGVGERSLHAQCTDSVCVVGLLTPATNPVCTEGL